ncbi:MAG TPA: 2Fe-2S iron-sulfur cluster-binding protein [Thermoplasmata archaeon]|nr:2Fe-2S iron-sulfur cluster-binding protein [Thermoplasmata archaeon]
MGTPDRRFSFRGRSYPVRDGETVLSALARERLPLLHRSIQYHRPQGPFCGIGHCTGCLVRVNGRPNVRACRYEPTAGDSVTTENAWPSAGFDVGATIGFLTPGGVDSLHGLRRPAFATSLFQRMVRRLAGTGKPPTEAAARALVAPALEHTTDVLVIGAGAAGRAVVAALIARGVRPLVLERAARPPPLAGADLLTGTSAIFLPSPAPIGDRRFTLLAFREPAQGIRVLARSVVIATGSYDASLLFDGNDRPGVLTADAAFALAPPPRRPPFRRAVVVGGGHRSAQFLEAYGDHVEAVVAPGEIRPEVVRVANEHAVLLYPRSLLLAARGRRYVRSVRLRARGGGVETHVACDAVVLAHRRIPHAQLFFQAGAAMRWRVGVAAYGPTVAPNGATSVPGLFAVGSAAGPTPSEADHAETVADAVLQGTSAPAPVPNAAPEETPTELLGYYRELLRTPGHRRWIACPCVDVLLSEVEKASRAGYRGIEVMKRYTSLGTGICQGRYCLPDALLVLSLLEGRPPTDVGYITQRPPVVPTPLAALAALPTSPATEVIP